MSVLFRALRVQGPELTDLLFYAGGAFNAVSVKMGGRGCGGDFVWFYLEVLLGVLYVSWSLSIGTLEIC